MRIGSIKRRPALAIAAAAIAATAGYGSASAADGARVPFQQSVLSKCNNAPGLKACRYNFPKVPAKRRLDIQFVNCAVEMSDFDPGIVSAASLGVNNGFNFPQAHLAWQARDNGNAVALTISQPVVFSIGAGNKAQIAFEYTGTLSAILSCGISGELVTLK